MNKTEKMKMRHDHVVGQSRLALHVLRNRRIERERKRREADERFLRTDPLGYTEEKARLALGDALDTLERATHAADAVRMLEARELVEVARKEWDYSRARVVTKQRGA